LVGGLIYLLLLLGLLYGFFVGLDMMGLAFKLFGRGFAEELIARTSNPFVGLFIGILATTLVQSSSATTGVVIVLAGLYVLRRETLHKRQQQPVIAAGPSARFWSP